MPPQTPTALPYIANTIAAIALIPSISGAAFLVSPAAGLQQMRLTSSTKTATGNEIGLFKMYAVRQCAVGEYPLCSQSLDTWTEKWIERLMFVRMTGLTTLAMWWTGSYRAMGLAGLSGALVAITDGFAAREMVDEKEGWKHWSAAPVGLGLTAALLYYTF